MDKYIVEITDEALADMDAIYQYIANILLAPENAMGQYNRIAEAILTLENCYMVDPGKVTVTDVLFGASNVHVRLQERHS